MGHWGLGTLFTTAGEPSRLGYGPASCRPCVSGKAQSATGIRMVALLVLCCGVAHAAVASTVGTGANLSRGGMPVTEKPQGGTDHKTRTFPPAHSAELPMLYGAGMQTRSSNRMLHTRLAGLTQYSDPALQFGQGLLWLNHTDQGAQGVGISVIPLSQAPQRLTIEGVYIDHEVGSVPASPAASHNKAWSLALNSRWLSERLTLHGEYAQSRKNHSAWDSLPESRSDQAYALLASYADQSHVLGSRPLVWGLTLDWQQAGHAFWSPTAGGVARDRSITRAAANIGWGELDARLSVAQATNNVADDPGVPTLCMNTLTADLHYTAREPIPSSGLGRLFADPSYALYLRHEHSGLEQAPEEGSATNIPDRYTDTASLTARFTPGPWWWEVSYSHSMLRVLGQQAPDMASNRTQLNLHLPLGNWLDLKPVLQWSLTDGQGTGDETRMITGTLGGTALLIPDRLAAKLNLRAHRRYSSAQQTEHETVAVESSLDWTLRSPQGNRPDVTVSLRGSYRYADNSASSADSSAQYQAFSGIQVSWPSAN